MKFCRRKTDRVPVRLFVDQFRGQEHWIGVSFNLSAGGIYFCQRPQAMPGQMGIELDLPGLSDTIWTRAEVRSVGSRGGFVGIGVAFTAMADRHRHMLCDWVEEACRQIRPAGLERRSSIRRLAA